MARYVGSHRAARNPGYRPQHALSPRHRSTTPMFVSGWGRVPGAGGGFGLRGFGTVKSHRRPGLFG